MYDPKLEKELARQIKSHTVAIGKTPEWLKFAIPTLQGAFRFLSHKELQWQVLEKIVEETSPLFPQYSKGQITDYLCSMVNR